MKNLFQGCLYLFPARESLFSDIPAGDGKIVNLFVYSALVPKTPKLWLEK